MKFETKQIGLFMGALQIALPPRKEAEINKLLEKAKNGALLSIEIKEKKPIRSLNANNYCWVLCQAIAEELSKDGMPFTRDDIYRQAIRKYSTPRFIPVPNEVTKEWIDIWCSRGVGWQAEDIGESKIAGYTKLMLFVGSSTFDTERMSRLLNGLVEDAKELGLDILSESDRALLLDKWEKERSKDGQD